MFQLIRLVFDKAGVRYTSAGLKKNVEGLPYSNSLYGVSAVMEKYNVGHKCVRYVDKNLLSKDDCPMVVVFQQQFVVVENVTDDIVSISMANGRQLQVSRQLFIDNWNGVALLIQSSIYSGEPDFQTNFKGERLAKLKNVGLIVSGLALLIGFMVIGTSSMEWWSRILLLLINAAGIAVSIMLLQKQVHIKNRVADKICSIAKESHCEAVTDSAGASIFGLVKLSEVGFGFFLINAIVIVAFPVAAFWLGVFAACVLPFSFWSVWYQKYKAKSWCVLCLTTLALMWLQAGVYLLAGTYETFSPTVVIPMLMLAGYVGAVLITNKTMQYIADARKNRFWHKIYEELKTNDVVVKAYEAEAPVYEVSDNNCSSLIFGNPEAEKILTLYSNPYCGPCAKMHEHIKDYPGELLGVRYVMTSFSKEKSNINRYIIAAYQQLGPETTWKIMTDWFAGGKKEGEAFFAKFNLNVATAEVDTEYDKHFAWASGKPLRGTPTEFLNGREIISPYSVDDYFFLSK